jgi:hypothetical protein
VSSTSVFRNEDVAVLQKRINNERKEGSGQSLHRAFCVDLRYEKSSRNCEGFAEVCVRWCLKGNENAQDSRNADRSINSL